MRKSSVAVLGSLLFAASAGGHPGHGDPLRPDTLTHYLSEPQHVLATFAAAIVVLAGAWLWRRRSRAAR